MAEPMSSVSILKVISPVLAGTKAAWKALRADFARRKASTGEAFQPDLVGTILDETLDLLTKRHTGTLNYVAGCVHTAISKISPEFNKPYIQEWLSDTDVREAFKQETLATFKGQDGHEARQAIVSLYEKFSGEHYSNAEYYIDMTCKYLFYSIAIYLEPSDELVLESIQDSTNAIMGKINGIGSQLSDVHKQLIRMADSPTKPYPLELVNDYVEKELACISKRKFFSEANALKDLLHLQERIDSGELAVESKELRVRLIKRIVQEYAGKDNGEEASAWLSKAKSLSADSDYTCDDARVLFCKKNFDGALRLIRDVITPEARSLLVSVILERDGVEKAISYYKEHIVVPSQLSSAGVLRLALAAAENSNLDFAEEMLKQMAGPQIDECPAVLTIRALVRFALSRPGYSQDILFYSAPLRPNLVEFSDEPHKVANRCAALDDIDLFLAEHAIHLNIPVYSAFMEDVQLWLRLVHPEISIREQAQASLKEMVQDVRGAIRWARFAFAYQIPIETDAIVKFLSSRKAIGGWEQHELMAILLIAMEDKAPHLLLSLIEDNREELEGLITQEEVISLEIEALARVGKFIESEAMLESSAEALGDKGRNYLNKHIEVLKGGDPVQKYREAFEITGDDGARQFLLSALLKNGFSKEAIEHMEYFFNKTPTYSMAEKIIIGMIKFGAHKQAKDFLERDDVKSLVAASPELRALSAWSNYYNSEPLIALAILSELPTDRNNPGNRSLAINIAQEIGDWEGLHKYLLEDYADRESLELHHLFAAAQTGCLTGLSRQHVIDFISSAAEKAHAENDPNALVRVNLLLSSVGEENEIADTALKRAMELSDKVHGHLQEYSVDELIPVLNAHKERVEHISKLISSADSPLFMAGLALNEPLSNIIAGSLIHNTECNDFRQKYCLPLFAGNRDSFVDLSRESLIAFDRTCLLTLSYLGLLEYVFESFESIFIAHPCIVEFLNEIESVRFHQPSQVRYAEKLQQYIASGKLQVISKDKKPTSFIPPTGLAWESARILGVAQENSGIFIVAGPQYDPSSRMNDQVDLSGCSSSISHIGNVVEFLVEESQLTQEEARRSREKLQGFITPLTSEGKLERHKSLYLDSLAAEGLIKADLVDKLARVCPNLFLGETTRDYAIGLTNHAERRKGVEEIINDVRTQVYQGVRANKIKFTPPADLDPQKFNGTELETRNCSFVHLVLDSGEAKYIAVDDRYANKLQSADHPHGLKVETVTTLDILNYLVKIGRISPQEYTEKIRALRVAGAALLPFGEEEFYVAALESQEQGRISIDLRRLADYINFIKLNKLLRFPEESCWLATAILSMLKSIHKIWESDLSHSSASAACNFLLPLLPKLEEWVSEKQVSEFAGWARSIKLAQFTYISDGRFLSDNIRRGAYLEWVETQLVPLFTHNDMELLAEASDWYIAAAEHVANKDGYNG